MKDKFCDYLTSEIRGLLDEVRRGLWQTHDYKALGIAGEPWLDVDFTK